MIEHVYKLKNFPSIQELLKYPNFKFIDDSIKDKLYYAGYSKDAMADILNLHLLEYLNIEWDYFVYFKKDNVNGFIHTDLDDLTTKFESTSWCINWVCDANSILKFWSWEDVSFYKKNKGSGVLQFLELRPPSHVYNLTSNNAYLVNSTMPHQAFGFKNCNVISLRSTLKLEWSQLLDIFKNHRITINNDI